ncbi:Rha family transcriptional regulator [Oscillibacter sp.]|uniref:Rha family transcriptional regulator n=1 Tax=Oscillibacter sp. TaxID=1945593 RepID=UPI0028A0A32C|nr:Rha family transcriptional regulator [Oscillibacter sp.]
MKELIPMDSYGVFADEHDTARANSLQVAEYFEKKHFHVLRDIQALDCSDDFRKSNFGFTTYVNAQGKKDKVCAMTRDGFMFLVMGYRGKKAAAIKEAYIKRFNDMERFIRTLTETRHEFPLLTAQIKLLYDNPKPYHYSNEADMLNRLALGMTAKQFREANGLRKGESIRPLLTPEQIDTIDLLQKIDLGLMLAMPDYHQRQRQLEWYLGRSKAISA